MADRFDGSLLPTLRSIDLDGPVRYRMWDGPGTTTFVLVHGLGGSHLNWLPVAPSLARLGRVVAPDLPGFGSSPRQGRGSALMDQRRVLSRFIRAISPERLVLAGNSMGGAVSILQAAVEPASVDGLVLTCSVLPFAGAALPHPLVVAAFAMYATPRVGDRLVGRRFRSLDAERAVRLGFRMCAADPSRVPEDLVGLTVQQVRARGSDPDAPAAFLDAARSMLRLGRRPGVARRAMNAVECPVQLLHGRRDRLVPVGYARAVLALHPSWRGRIFPDLGHIPQVEAPERWLREVADWHRTL